MSDPSDGDPASLSLSLMPAQREVSQAEDDWTGVTSTAERRRLQNRLNQRAWRRRQHSLVDQQSQPMDHAEASNQPSSQFQFVEPGTAVALGDIPESSICSFMNPEVRNHLQRFKEQALLDYEQGSLRPHNLSTLIEVNIFNALMNNAIAIDRPSDWLLDDAVSIFCQHGPGMELSAVQSLTAPDNLKPTQLQLTIHHHPWIDLFPCPKMRDNLLIAVSEPDAIDEDDLCKDLMEVSEQPEGERACLFVWGEPWSPRGWEASPAFLKKWGWLLKGCGDVLDATNDWREKRGEDRLTLDEYQ